MRSKAKSKQAFARYHEILEIVQKHPGLTCKEIRLHTDIRYDSQVHIVVNKLAEQGLVYRDAECKIQPGKAKVLKDYDTNPEWRSRSARLGAQNRRARQQTLAQRIEKVAKKAAEGLTDNVFGDGWYLRQHSH